MKTSGIFTAAAGLVAFAAVTIFAMSFSPANPASAAAPASDDQGHVLTKLWRQLESARRSDLPQDQLKVLTQIKDEARAKHLPVDFYDAVQQSEQTNVRINWKVRDAQHQLALQEIEGFDEPVVTYAYWHYHDENGLRSFFAPNRERLEKTHNPEFYKRDWAIRRYYYSDALLENLQNDAEYVVWSLFSSGMADSTTVSDVCQGRYPLQQFLEYERDSQYFNADGERGRTRRLEAYAEKYKDRAVSLLARQELLGDRFQRLNEKDASSEDYKALREDCARFERDRKAFMAKERTLAECCTSVAGLIDALDSKDLEFDIRDSQLTVRLRNLDHADLRIEDKDKKTVFKVTLTNPVRSYYRLDTIRFTLPPINDGSYTAWCTNGKIEREADWEKYTLSLATKYDAGGFWAWATDYRTGEPIPAFKTGFKHLDKKEYDSYEAVYEDNGIIRRSQPGALVAPGIGPHQEKMQLQCILLTDRAAFNPDETVQFKAILYRKGYRLTGVAAGKSVKATLYDAQGKEIKSTTLTTSEFGSVDGSFVLERRERNGRYRLEISADGESLATQALTVDDFVLPTYALSFDRIEKTIYAGDTARVSGTLKAYSGHSLSGARVTYRIERWGQLIKEGPVEMDGAGRFSIVFPTHVSDGYQNYLVQIHVVDGTGETADFGQSVPVRSREQQTRDQRVRTYYFEDDSDTQGPAIRLVAGDQPVWAVVDLYGRDGKLIDSRVEYIPAGSGAPTEKIFRRDWQSAWGDVVTLSVLYFQDKERHSYSVTWRCPDTRYDLPLQFTRFLDTTLPGTEYSFTIRTGTGVEVAATVFDKSSETIRPNRWSTVRANAYPAFSPRYSCKTGDDRTRSFEPILMRGAVQKNASVAEARMMASAAGAMLDDVVLLESAVLEREPAMAYDAAADEESVSIREDFATTIAWEPCLYSDKDGNVTFTFRNADKLSTFYVQLFAHDGDMRNETLRREMVVSLPVKIAVVEPQFLYENDSYRARISLSSSVDREVSGTISVNGTSVPVTLPPYSQRSVEVPVAIAPASAELVLTAIFRPDNAEDGSDGVRVRIPVHQPVQTITEAHSAVLLHGMDRDALIRSLRDAFVAIPGENAALREISILDMVREAVPQTFETDQINSVSLGKTLYAATLAAKIGSAGLSADQLEELVERLLACRNSDGGFAWIRGMDSSPVITAQLLDYLGGLIRRGLDVPDAIREVIPTAVRYVDASYFRDPDRPWWRGRLSLDQYLYVRALFPDVPFTEKTTSDFRKEARSYLVPTRARGLNGAIFAKARRLLTLQWLGESKEGIALARKFGISLFTASRIRKSLNADTASLVQYAVAHPHGGMYYPNAVMPWRGLLESELYAHSLLCDLMAGQGQDAIAEGIRIWLMLQKETQSWGSDPAIVNALSSVLDGSEATLDTRVVALSGSYTRPFEQIPAAGNGFTVSRSFYRLDADDHRIPVREGDVVQVGDRILAVYSIWNAENRSFVRLTAPRPACLRPENQLSGYAGRAYRNVKADCSEFWYETYPEENTSVTETFFVTQSGEFHSGVPVIECLYAPHYRANGTSFALFRSNSPEL